MCYIDLDVAEVWSETKRRARKEHKCSCCRRAIQPGESYLVHFSILDGYKTTGKCCAECERDRKEFGKTHEGQVPSSGFFREVLDECICDGDPEDQRWLPMARRIFGPEYMTERS